MKKSIILVLLVCFLGCKKEKGSEPDDLGAPIAIEYHDKVVVLDQEDVIVFINEDDQIYTLKKGAFKNQPKVGEVILVPGEMMRKVKSVKTSGNNYVIETEDAALTEVIENGSFAFDIQPEWSDASSIMVDGKEMLTNELTMSMSASRQVMAIKPIESSITSGGITHTIRITPTKENGRIISCNFKLMMSKGGSTSFVAEGNASLPSQSAEIVIKDGKLTKFNSNNKGIKADFKVTMATAGGKSGAHSLKLPKVAITIPIKVIPTPAGPMPNPIPMSISVGMQFVSDITVVDQMSSATGKSSVNFDADAGFTFTGTDINTSGGLNSGDITEGTFDSAAGFGMPIDLQFGLAFPRVSLNIAGQEVAYVHIGYTTGSKLSWAPLCKRGYSKMLIEGGYALNVLGIKVLEGQKDIFERVKRAGDDCD
jgi:hypothetical protein